MQPNYPKTDPNPDFVALEKQVLKFWQEKQVFASSVAHRNGEKDFVFYDGPPFANGLPHYGHLLTGYVKDLFARYQTMRGKRVERRFGWDCHGLPAEMGAEKELNISGRQQIMDYGIAEFNNYCRSSVMKYTGEWEKYVNAQARWVDFQDDYKTMDVGYMESVIWAFKELHNKGLLYESYRVMPYSWAAETPLSNFETRLDNAYRNRTDKAVTVAFELAQAPVGAPQAQKYYLLAWTTTPWTLPSNLGLAVSKDIEYGCELKENNCYISAEYADDKISGGQLIGLRYQPLMPYFAEQNAFRVLDGSDFIEAGSGTGVVHMAPGFGEDDQRVCENNNIAIICPVDNAGKYTDEIYDLPNLRLRGLNVIADIRKDEQEPYTEAQLQKYGLANLRIITWLKETGKLIKQDDYEHNYPHCWRTDKPLIYKAVPSWYVEVTKFRDRMVELNQQIHWIPGHIKDGLFGKWLENARDWSISRNRFWGCPIPVWKSNNPANKEIYVFGSIKELEAFFGEKVEDLHRPFIDNLTKPDPLNSEYTITRVEDVFDCWFESGSMPYAQLHYPFENKEKFEKNYPADFIVEYQAQTRGWFYTLMVLGTALFDKPPFLNCICHGVVLDAEGQKLSKRLNNYPDPLLLFDQYGADALRWFMMSSPIMRGAELYIDKEGAFIRDAVRLYIKPLWNAYNFFSMYANADGVRAEFVTQAQNPMDAYILAKCGTMAQAVQVALDGYDTPAACVAITNFLEVLNNWYIRRSRPRFWKKEVDADKQAAYDILYTVLHVLCRAAAPLLPLLSEQVFLGLTANGKWTASASVHLQDFPTELNNLAEDKNLLSDMDRVREICNVAHAIRNEENIRIRQPLALLTCYGATLHDNIAYYSSVIEDETNIKQVNFSQNLEQVADKRLKISFPIAGKRLGGKMKEVANNAKNGAWEMKNGVLNVSGEDLLPEEYELALEPKIKQGAGALPAQDGLVVLDINITAELAQEGIARDVVRMVQQARKDAGLDITDRIKVSLKAGAGVETAVRAYHDFIAQQVLADIIECGVAIGDKIFELNLEGEALLLALSKI